MKRDPRFPDPVELIRGDGRHGAEAQEGGLMWCEVYVRRDGGKAWHFSHRVWLELWECA